MNKTISDTGLTAAGIPGCLAVISDCSGLVILAAPGSLVSGLEAATAACRAPSPARSSGYGLQRAHGPAAPLVNAQRRSSQRPGPPCMPSPRRRAPWPAMLARIRRSAS
jgi:hypothetical protein